MNLRLLQVLVPLSILGGEISLVKSLRSSLVERATDNFRIIYKLAESYLKMKAGWDYPEAILLSGRRNYRADKEMTSST